MNESPLVSVIIPVYNVEAYLKRCLDSVVNQTYKNLQIILVDDGSPDNCGAICDQYATKDKRITVIHQENGGLSAARNAGIELIRGDYTTFIDSDDWIHLNMIKAMVEVALDTKAEVVTCEHLRPSGEDVISVTEDSNRNVMTTSIENYLERYFKISDEKPLYYTWGKLYQSSLIIPDMYPVGLTHEDILGTYRAIRRSHTIAEIDFPYYFYYFNPNSITNTEFSEKAFDYFPVWDLLISECDGEIKEYAKYNKQLHIYGVLSTMAINDPFYRHKYSSQVITLLKDLKNESRVFLRHNWHLKRRIIRRLMLVNYGLFSDVIHFVAVGRSLR